MPHHSHADLAHDAASAAIKAAPPVAVTAAGHIAGWTIDYWILVCTLIYLVLQIGYLVWRWSRDIRRANFEAAE